MSRRSFGPTPLQAAQAKLRAAEDRRAAANTANDLPGYLDAMREHRVLSNEIARLNGKPPVFTAADFLEFELLRNELIEEGQFRPLASAVTFASHADRPARIAELLTAYPHLKHAQIDFDSHFPLLPLASYPTSPTLTVPPADVSPDERAFYDAWNVWQTAKWYGTPEETEAARLALESTREARDKAVKLRTAKS